MKEHLPPRDRRQKRRILTIRNTSWFAVVVLALFAGLAIWNELHPRSNDGLALVEERKREMENDVVLEPEPYMATKQVVSEHDPSDLLWAEKPPEEDLLGVDLRDQYGLNEIRPLESDVEPAAAVSLPGVDAPLLEHRSTRKTSRVKISGAGSSLKLETKDDED